MKRYILVIDPSNQSFADSLNILKKLEDVSVELTMDLLNTLIIKTTPEIAKELKDDHSFIKSIEEEGEVQIQ